MKKVLKTPQENHQKFHKNRFRDEGVLSSKNRRVWKNNVPQESDIITCHMNAVMKSVPIGVNLTSTLANDQKVQSSDAIINDTLQQVTIGYLKKTIGKIRWYVQKCV